MLAGEDEDWPPWLFVNSNDCLFSLSELNLANIIQVMHGLLKPYMNADLFNRAPGKFLSRDATFKLTGRSTGEAEGYVFYMGDWHDVVWYGAVLHPNSANELIPADMRLARRLKRLGKEGVHMPRMPPLPALALVGWNYFSSYSQCVPTGEMVAVYEDTCCGGIRKDKAAPENTPLLFQSPVCHIFGIRRRSHADGFHKCKIVVDAAKAGSSDLLNFSTRPSPSSAPAPAPAPAPSPLST